MMHHSAFARALRIACWVGDVALVGLAVFLAISNRDSISINLALILALCVVLGGSLPLAVYLIDYLYERNERERDVARAPENLRQTMIRIDQMVRRVEDAAEDATKATLISRQVPDRIEEKMGILHEAAVRLRPESLENVAVGIEQLGNRLNELSEKVLHLGESEESGSEGGPGVQSDALNTVLALLSDIEKLIKAGQETPESSDSDLGSKLLAIQEVLEARISGLERGLKDRDIEHNSLIESLIQRIDTIEESWQEDWIYERSDLDEDDEAEELDDNEDDVVPFPASRNEPEEISEVEQDPEVEEAPGDTDDFNEDALDESDEVELEEEVLDSDDSVVEDDWVEEPETFEPEDEFLDSFEEVGEGEDSVESSDETEAPIEEEPETLSEVMEEEIEEDSSVVDSPPEEPEEEPGQAVRKAPENAELFGADEIASGPPPPDLPEDTVRITAKAMVGVSNRIFVRGNAPLSWEKGTALALSGIGEWQLELQGVSEPLQCEFRLNDEIVAMGPPLEVAPGEAVTVSPKFPR